LAEVVTGVLEPSDPRGRSGTAGVPRYLGLDGTNRRSGVAFDHVSRPTLIVASSTKPAFRGDVDGLRAVAILVVAAFHIGFPGFAGGFIGVDVFFVISGYLITRNLLPEVAATGSLRLGKFWAARVRRLVPGLALVTIVVLVAALAIMSPFDWARAAKDALASTFYVSNYTFAGQARTYFAPDVNTSLFLHTWSLAVEEQFYVVWPLIILAVAVLSRRRPQRLRKHLLATLVVMVVLSFGLAVELTRRDSPLAFYSLPTRMWEFGLAGALACVEAALVARAERLGPRRSARLAMGGAIVGLGAILVASVTMSAFSPHPGFVTLIPVFGTLAVIGFGAVAPVGPVAWGLRSSPAQWLGRVSYSWYLWHWPVMKLVVVATVDTLATRTLGVTFALGIAALSYRFVENPLRYAPRLITSPKRSFAFGLAAVLVVTVLGFAVHTKADHTLDEAFYQALAEPMAPSPACTHQTTSSGTALCAYGDPKGSRTVALYGDSHAARWLPVLDQVGKANGIRVVSETSDGCPTVDVHTAPTVPHVGDHSTCVTFRNEMDHLVDDLRPDGVIMGSASYLGFITDASGHVLSDDEEATAWKQAFRDRVSSFASKGARVGVLLDNPTLPSDPNSCIARHESVEPCPVSTADAMRIVKPFRDAEQSVLDELHTGQTFDLASTICPDEQCRLELDGNYVYSDNNHLRYAFVQSQASAFTPMFLAVAGSPS
jgi:peptidoglycan/LPS O-acetylase OafA/YrhL